MRYGTGSYPLKVFVISYYRSTGSTNKNFFFGNLGHIYFRFPIPNVRGFSPNFVSISPNDNFSGNSDVPRSLDTLLAQARSMLTIRVHIFASRPSDDCSDVPVGSF